MKKNKIFDSIIKIELINKGWSEDKKYCVTVTNGTKYLLRITPISRYEIRKSLFDMLEKADDLNIPMCKPIEFGICDEGVYSIQSWIDGEDLETVLPLLSETEQYLLGLKSGEIVRKMHTLPAPETQEEWESRFNRKTEMKIKKYYECGLRFEGDEYVLSYIEQNRHLLKNRPQSFQHGDFHIGNMMLEKGELKIIDFDRYDFGDPWEEFNRIVWSAAASPHFATGQLRGYFGADPPIEFFKLLAFYISSNTLSSIYWAASLGSSDLNTMMKQAHDVLKWFDNMQNPVPVWYLKGYELWDIFDINRNKTGRFTERGKPMQNGDCHLIVQVWIMNSKGEFLISRQVTETGDNKWMTTGGCVIAGEDGLSAVLRETKEELSIDLNPINGKLFKQYSKPHVNDEGTALFDIWVFCQNVEIENIIFKSDETCDAMWASKDKINQMIIDGIFISEWYPYLDELFCICDIPEFRNFTKIKLIEKGQSDDKKYYIETIDNKQLFLRLADIQEYERKKAEYKMMERVYNFGILTPKPYVFGLCNKNNNCYSLSDWLEGETIEELLPNLREAEQYNLGLKTGAVLREIHNIPAPDNVTFWGLRFRQKIQKRIDLYNEYNLKNENGDKIIKYLNDKQNLLDSRPQTFWHGDFNVGNQMVMSNGEIAVFDYNYWNLDYGDPWWEFVIIPWGKEPPAHYITGMINGYFNNDPPYAFFEMLSYYYACDALSALCYSFLGMEKCVPEDGRKHMENILRWFDNLNNPVPEWYFKNFYIQWTNGIPYKLEAPFDFSFLNKYGKVFKVFDEQGSGNISFGIENGNKKYFVKFAGAPKPNYISNRETGAANPESAIKFLKAAVNLYMDLKHPNLIKLISAEEIGNGYAIVFEWENAIGIEPKGSPDYMKFMQMQTEKKMRAFEDIMEFHAYVAAKGYVALDFYDGGILYDYDKDKVVICDIDLYQKSPFVNADGLGLVGSARYVSPEECVHDEIIDEITNVYTMGATAFALFAYGERSFKAWTLSEKLYNVAKKAVSDERNKRQQSIQQFIQEWRTAEC